MKGTTIQRRLTVEVISFSAHVDGEQNLDFIEQVKAQHIVSFSDNISSHFSKLTFDIEHLSPSQPLLLWV